MANTYLTGNAVGSTAVKDLYDNASNFDDLLLGPAPSYPDRLLKRRQSWAGMEQAFEDFLLASGYVYIGDYDASGELTFTQRNQIMSKDGEFWRPNAELALPYTTVNDWVVDQPKFVSTGDAALRQDLATLGTAVVAKSTMSLETIAELRDVAPGALAANIWVARYTSTGPLIGSSYKLDPSDTTSPDDGGSIIVNNDGVRRYKLVTGDSMALVQFGHDGTAAYDVRAILQTAIAAAYTAGVATVNIAGVLKITDEVLLYPNVRLKGEGIGRTYVNLVGTSKTAFRTVKPVGYTAPLCIGASIEDFTLNGIAVGNQNTGLDLSDCDKFKSARIEYANMLSGLHFNKYAAATAGAFPYGKCFEAQILQCQFASCGNATTWQGASNRCTFIGNSYNSCTTAFAFDSINNYSETNDFYNESVEGCNSWAEWSAVQANIYSQNWYGMTVENPTSNPFLCLVKDPGRQNFYGCRMIPGDNTGVSFYQLFPGVYSAIFGSKGSSDRNSLGCRIPEEIWSIRGIRHLFGYGVSGFSATIGAGVSSPVSIVVAGAQPGDIVQVCADKDLQGCVLAAHVSAVDTVFVRVQNCTAGSVSLSAVSITALVSKTGAVGPIV